MIWRKLRFGLVLLPVLLLYGNEYRRGCFELKDYVFTVAASQPSLADGESTELSFVFYPVRERRMTFHTAPHEQLSLWSSLPFDDAPYTPLPDRESPMKSRKYGMETPLVNSVSVARTDDEDGTVKLSFGMFGTITTESILEIELGAALYPALVCFLDSNEGFHSENVTIYLE